MSASEPIPPGHRITDGLAYRPDIDGLRALAILAVVAFHLEPSALRNGYLGVDVFFVISGFLIASLIRQGCDAGVFSLKEFYRRRVKRLFPAMGTVLGVCLAYGALTYQPWIVRSLGSQVISVLALVANFKMWSLAGDYWGQQAQELLLLHTWSLAVEEQFYLLFPIAFLGLLRLGRGPAIVLLGTTAAASLALSWYWSIRAPDTGFYLLPARAWELLAGCLLAVTPPASPGGSRRLFRRLSVAGLTAILLALCLPAQGVAPTFLVRVLAVAGSVAFIASTGGSGGWIERLFSMPPIVLLGRMSYSIYLWHWPVIVVCRRQSDAPIYGLDSNWVVAVSILATVTFGAISYWGVEQPLRRWKGTLRASLAAGVLLLAASIIVRQTSNGSGIARSGQAGGWGGGTPDFEPITVHGASYSIHPYRVLEVTDYKGNRAVHHVTPAVTPTLEHGVVRPGRSTSLDVLVLGDSHAISIAPAIDRILQLNGLSGEFWLAPGVPPDLFRGAHGDLFELKSSEVDMLDRKQLEALRRRPKVCIVSMRYDNAEFSKYRKTYDYIAANSVLIVIQQPPVLNIGNRHTVEAMDAYRPWVTDWGQLRIREPRQTAVARSRYEASLRDQFAGNPRFVFFETERDLLLPDGRIRWWDGKSRLYYVDDDHLSEAGVDLFSERLGRTLLNLLEAGRR